MQEITVDAVVENIDVVTAFADDFLDSYDCPMKAKIQIDVAIDEIFSNIAYYAYQNQQGKASVRFEILDNPRTICITFIDNGVPYNPLKKEDPDVTLPAEERKIGGLGIYMVKKTMDEVSYNYCDRKNVLVLRKRI